MLPFLWLCNTNSSASSSGNVYSAYTLPLSQLFRPDFVYLMIKNVYKSFGRYVDGVEAVAVSYDALKNHGDAGVQKDYDYMGVVLDFSNTLQSIEQVTVPQDPFTYPDFLTQLRGRSLKDKGFVELMGISDPGSAERHLDALLKSYSNTLSNDFV